MVEKTLKKNNRISLWIVGVIVGMTILYTISPDVAYGLLGGATAIGAVLLYFLPSIVANKRKKDNATAITVLNLFLGWTLIGWVIALVWAVSKDK